tara:strand:+ start:3834 stop:4061 length:228 start_codon:yes stop_codon:yes gene_type:complete
MFNKAKLGILAALASAANSCATYPVRTDILVEVKPNRYCGNSNTTKQYGQASFQQNRRKDLKARAKVKAKKRGQV